MFTRIVSSALALSLIAGATPAAAQTSRVEVAFGDLDLTSEAGRATLDTRLQAAARKVCGGRINARDLGSRQAYRTCVNEAKLGYEPQVRIALSRAGETTTVAVLTSGLRNPA
ncbi:UrcA family protein [Alteriqipengyuania lutimaris]|uniref:UrcA family protein n=1 Tax=Alteriqipengyuania lutimaris TaxID=1538146 RepID=A0A395LHR1_9SPHN|nr:UrcA family protein [Alteriqipengyuania lutimaris]MBB3034663.1 UrcA family protein [Alteriqipengyuania lutimaris]RDS76476.1 UrcA family protein [Alteriqipengyuania lutimaris]